MAIAYKGTYNLACRDMKYKAGETYKISAAPVICERGFHFCIVAEDVFTYYPFTKNFKLLEVDILGDVKHQDSKSVTNEFKVLRELDLSKMEFRRFKFDSAGCLIKQTDNFGRAFDMQFDKNGNIIYFKKPDGRKVWFTYNWLGNVTRRIDDKGIVTHYNYWMWKYLGSRTVEHITNSSFSIQPAIA